MSTNPETNYPANSHKNKEEASKKAERERLEPVVEGKVKTRKPGLGKRVADTFSGDDASTVGEYILFDVVIPAAKATISDALSQGVERLLFGDVRRRPNGGPRVGGGSYVSYNRVQPQPSRGRAFESEGRQAQHQMSPRARAVHDFDEIILETRGEAERVLEGMSDVLEAYDVVTVSDLYDLIGQTGSYTDDKWGWFDLRAASVERIRGGYLLNLPKTKPID